MGEFLSLITLDSAKAFDVVWQASLLRKIYHEGVDGTLLTLSCMVSNAITSVKVAFYHCFSIGNNVNISSPCSKTLHTKFTKPLSF